MILFLLATAMTTGLVAADCLTVSRLIDDARSFRSTGASIVTLTETGRVSGLACEALNVVPGVEASGALRSTDERLALGVLPAAPLPLSDSTEGMAGVLGVVSGSAGGLLIPASVREALGGAAAMSFMTTAGRAFVAGVYEYPSDGRRAGFGWAALRPAPAEGLFDECWAAVWPPSSTIRQLLLSTVSSTVASDDETQPHISQLNTRMGESFDGSAAFSARATSYSPIVVALVGILLSAVAVRGRRLEFAARLHDGLRKRDLQVIQLAENAIWSIPSAIVASVTGTVISLLVGAPDARSLGLTAVITSGVLIMGAAVGGVGATFVVRETHLFRYFKSR